MIIPYALMEMLASHNILYCKSFISILNIFTSLSQKYFYPGIQLRICLLAVTQILHNYGRQKIPPMDRIYTYLLTLMVGALMEIIKYHNIRKLSLS